MEGSEVLIKRKAFYGLVNCGTKTEIEVSSKNELLEIEYCSIDVPEELDNKLYDLITEFEYKIDDVMVEKVIDVVAKELGVEKDKISTMYDESIGEYLDIFVDDMLFVSIKVRDLTTFSGCGFHKDKTLYFPLNDVVKEVVDKVNELKNTIKTITVYGSEYAADRILKELVEHNGYDIVKAWKSGNSMVVSIPKEFDCTHFKRSIIGNFVVFECIE